MQKISYHYTNVAKQALFIVCFIYVLLRLLIMMEIIVFKIDGYYEATNIPLTLLMYIVIFAAIFALFRGHKFCYSLYDEHQLIYHNTLLRRAKTLDLSQIKLAVFDTLGVKFYDDENADSKKDTPMFFLPFFRNGIITAVHIDRFYKMLKGNASIRIEKNFTILPGYSNKWRFVTIAYAFLAIVIFMNCSTPITVVIVLFQNH